MPSPDDTDRTPAQSPAAKRSSGELRLGLSDCPKCEGSGVRPPIRNSPDDAPCDLCLGARKVTLSTCTAWLLDQGRLADSEPPDTEPPQR